MSNKRSSINSYSQTISSFLKRMDKSEPCPNLVARLNGPAPPPRPRRPSNHEYSNNSNIYNDILSKVLTKDDLRLINGPVPVPSNGPFWWSEVGSAGHPEATYLPEVTEDKEGMVAMDLTFPIVATTMVSEVSSTTTTTSEGLENRLMEKQSRGRQKAAVVQGLDQTTAVSRVHMSKRLTPVSISKDEYAEREVLKPRPRQGLRPQPHVADWNRYVPPHHLYVRSLKDLEQVNEKLEVWLKSQRISRLGMLVRRLTLS